MIVNCPQIYLKPNCSGLLKTYFSTQWFQLQFVKFKTKCNPDSLLSNINYFNIRRKSKSQCKEDGHNLETHAFIKMPVCGN